MCYATGALSQTVLPGARDRTVAKTSNPTPYTHLSPRHQNARADRRQERYELRAIKCIGGETEEESSEVQRRKERCGRAGEIRVRGKTDGDESVFAFG